ncbi:unnamed protein product [Trypanosoma congolense IL3000]|uniref:WGS project CAEQ00000000 data, annotated contig 154 n=1 Tax=Trypanosoma congolense (strain IL3000) TaxID=1068625 RepID=F9W6Z6_TRYCI|nr:unnamed protein product [Trypanosoma congolense IL3000]
MRSLQILLITWSLSAVTKGNNNGGINEAEFREMCSFIKLLQKRPNIPTLEAQDSTSEIPTQALRAVNRIRILNASTADASTYDSLAKGEEFAKLKENRVVVQMGEQKWAELVQLWKDNQGQFFPDPRKLGADELRVIHGKLGSILQKAENTYERNQKTK